MIQLAVQLVIDGLRVQSQKVAKRLVAHAQRLACQVPGCVCLANEYLFLHEFQRGIDTAIHFYHDLLDQE